MRKEDLIAGGLFRKCDVYRAGGGYDKFPDICKKRLGYNYRMQFVVQLFGCNLNCYYCYVTKDGVFGDFILLTTDDIVHHFDVSGLKIFHLMGGAPALYIENWWEIIQKISGDTIFHSDLLLTEKRYKAAWLDSIVSANCLYAVSIKGLSKVEYEKNTRVRFNEGMFWDNFDAVVKHGVPFYLTFTGIDTTSEEYLLYLDMLSSRYGNSVIEDAVALPLVQYNAMQDNLEIKDNVEGFA